MKEAIVRKGYVVHWRNEFYREGVIIPPQILKEIENKQSWKLNIIEIKEDSNGKTKENEESKKSEETKIEDISTNRMVEDSLIKKRGRPIK
jgi:23S rRNA pseudoU1915 N3-methylase RlmH